jgi:hypothetical protein
MITSDHMYDYDVIKGRLPEKAPPGLGPSERVPDRCFERPETRRDRKNKFLPLAPAGFMSDGEQIMASAKMNLPSGLPHFEDIIARWPRQISRLFLTLLGYSAPLGASASS